MGTHGFERFYLCLIGELVVLFVMKKTCCLEVVSWLALLIAYFHSQPDVDTPTPSGTLKLHSRLFKHETSRGIIPGLTSFLYKKKGFSCSHVVLICHNSLRSISYTKTWNIVACVVWATALVLFWSLRAFGQHSLSLKEQNNILLNISCSARWRRDNHSVLERNEGE